MYCSIRNYMVGTAQPTFQELCSCEGSCTLSTAMIVYFMFCTLQQTDIAGNHSLWPALCNIWLYCLLIRQCQHVKLFQMSNEDAPISISGSLFQMTAPLKNCSGGGNSKDYKNININTWWVWWVNAEILSDAVCCICRLRIFCWTKIWTSRLLTLASATSSAVTQSWIHSVVVLHMLLQNFFKVCQE